MFLANEDEIVPSAEVRRFLEAPQPPPFLTHALELVLGKAADTAPKELAEALAEARAVAGDTSLAAHSAIEVETYTAGHGRWQYSEAMSRRVVGKALELADRVDDDA